MKQSGKLILHLATVDDRSGMPGPVLQGTGLVRMSSNDVITCPTLSQRE